MKLKIGILGTRGIPNHYGGFEQFAAYLSRGLARRGHMVSVYNSHNHPYSADQWEGVNIIHCYDPEYLLGTAGQFFYDRNCIMDARKRNFDILLVLGYTSSSVWGQWYPAGSKIITNMDGLEWRRSKYSKLTKEFLQVAEKLAVKYSHRLVADAEPVQEYLFDKYRVNATYIAYGAEISDDAGGADVKKYLVDNSEYALVIARMEPENHIEMILEAMAQQKKIATIVVGNTDNRYGKKMLSRFGYCSKIRFAGAVFDQQALRALRLNCRVYFHGHSVGGTNPSLLEAMADGALICAHDNCFNRSVLQNRGFYFQQAADILELTEQLPSDDLMLSLAMQNRYIIHNRYNWNKIIDAYEQLFIQTCFENIL